MTVVTPRVLVVSGSRICRRVVEMTFADQPVELAVAAGGADAIEAWDSRSAAVVLVDLGLEPPGALAVIRHVLASSGDRPVGVLVMAGPSDVVDAAALAQDGVRAVIRKPLDSLQLIEAVRDVLRAARLPRMQDTGAVVSLTASGSIKEATEVVPSSAAPRGIVLDDDDLERVAARVAAIWSGDAGREAHVRDVVTARAEGLATAVAERLVPVAASAAAERMVREMAPALVQQVARAVVADVSERLVREEIARMRSLHQAR